MALHRMKRVGFAGLLGLTSDFRHWYICYGIVIKPLVVAVCFVFGAAFLLVQRSGWLPSAGPHASAGVAGKCPCRGIGRWVNQEGVISLNAALASLSVGDYTSRWMA